MIALYSDSKYNDRYQDSNDKLDKLWRDQSDKTMGVKHLPFNFENRKNICQNRTAL